MFCDESNLNRSGRDFVEFFIYGGLVVETEQIEELHTTIGEIRDCYGFRPEDSLKFGLSTLPDQISEDHWHKAHEEVRAACETVGAKFLAVLVHHEIANRQRLIEWQFKPLANGFNEHLLAPQEDVGMVVMDRLSGEWDEFELMEEVFRFGSTSPSGWTFDYSRIVSYSATCDGASHLASAADVVLGTFRHCVNQRSDLTVPRQLAPEIAPLLHRRPWDDQVWWNGGLRLNPRESPFYGHDYTRLKTHLREIGLTE